MKATEYAQHLRFNRYLIHQFICDVFDEPSVKFQVSTGNEVVILIQSNSPVKKYPSVGVLLSKEIDINVFTLGTYRISVDLNAVRQIKIDGKKNSKKIPVVGNDVVDWIQNRSDVWGIRVNDIVVHPTQNERSVKGSTNIDCRWHKVQLTANVVDVDKFHKMILNGIGSQKSFGYGMIKAIKIK